MLSIVSSLGAAVTAVCRSSVSVSSFVIAAIVAACFRSNTSSTSSAVAAALVVCCCSRISKSSFVDAKVFTVCCSSISSSYLVAAVVVFVCFESRIYYPLELLPPSSSCVAPEFPNQSFIIAAVVVVCCRSSTSNLLVCIFSDEFGQSRGSIDARYLVYLLRMGNENAQSPICGRSQSGSCSLPPRQCKHLLFLLSINYHVVQLFLFHIWGSESVLCFKRNNRTPVLLLDSGVHVCRFGYVDSCF